jgi:hypothetical protein
MSDSYVPPSNPISRAGTGVVGGLAGGVVLGLVLVTLADIRPIAGLVGKSSIEVAWTVLLMICAIAGSIYGALAGHSVSRQIVPAIGVGIVYGGVWWILVALVAVPLRNGGSVFTFGDDAMRVLGGWVAFGVILGVIYALTGPRRRAQYRTRWRDSRAYNAIYSMPRPRRRRRNNN